MYTGTASYGDTDEKDESAMDVDAEDSGNDSDATLDTMSSGIVPKDVTLGIYGSQDLLGGTKS